MYETDVSWGDVYARADWSWSDEYNTSYAADPRLMQDAYSWLNFRVGTHWDNYELVAWVDNATRRGGGQLRCDAQPVRQRQELPELPPGRRAPTG